MEIDIVFFSEDVEILNSIMYIFSALKYPLDNSNYNQCIVSLTKDNLDSIFVNRMTTSMLGVNSSYEEGNQAVKRVMTWHNIVFVDVSKNELSLYIPENNTNKSSNLNINVAFNSL